MTEKKLNVAEDGPQEKVELLQININLPTNRPAKLLIPYNITPPDIGYITQCLTDMLMQEIRGTAPKPSPIIVPTRRIS